MISKFNRTIARVSQVVKKHRTLVATASMASLVFLSGCTSSRAYKDGRPYCVKRLNLGLVQVEVAHRDDQSAAYQQGCHEQWQGDGSSSNSSTSQPIVNDPGQWSNDQNVVTETQQETLESFQSMPTISKETFENNRTQPASQQYINQNEPTPAKESSRRRSSNQQIENHTSSNAKLPALNIPFERNEQIGDAQQSHQNQSNGKVVKIETPTNNAQDGSTLKSLASEFVAPPKTLPEPATSPLEQIVTSPLEQIATSPLEQVATSPLKKTSSELATSPLEQAVTSPLKLVARGKPNQQPLERLASLGQPDVLPGPVDGLQPPRQEEVASPKPAVEPMIRLRAIPIQKPIPAMPSLAQFRDLPSGPQVEQLAQPEIVRPHEATGRNRDNWR